MSNVNPLRAEFVLTGLAFLASLIGFALALRPELFNGIHLRDVEHLALPLTVGGIAAAYVLGIVAVQATFFIPTEHLIARTRRSRFDDLRELKERIHTEQLEKGFPAADAQALLIETAPEQPAMYEAKLSLRRVSKRKARDEVIRHAQTLVVTAGRAYMPSQLTDEYKYRRANRQVFVGMLPSVIFGGAAGVIAVGLSWWLFAIGAACILAVAIIWLSAKYQEEVAQSMILDTAFLRR